MNDSVHVILKPKEMKRHSYVDVPPDIKLFNARNVSGMYETIDSMMARSYKGNYKGGPRVHQLKKFFMFLREYEYSNMAGNVSIRLKNKEKPDKT